MEVKSNGANRDGTVNIIVIVVKVVVGLVVSAAAVLGALFFLATADLDILNNNQFLHSMRSKLQSLSFIAIFIGDINLSERPILNRENNPEEIIQPDPEPSRKEDTTESKPKPEPKPVKAAPVFQKPPQEDWLEKASDELIAEMKKRDFKSTFYVSIVYDDECYGEMRKLNRLLRAKLVRKIPVARQDHITILPRDKRFKALRKAEMDELVNNPASYDPESGPFEGQQKGAEAMLNGVVFRYNEAFMITLIMTGLTESSDQAGISWDYSIDKVDVPCAGSVKECPWIDTPQHNDAPYWICEPHNAAKKYGVSIVGQGMSDNAHVQIRMDNAHDNALHELNKQIKTKLAQWIETYNSISDNEVDRQTQETITFQFASNVIRQAMIKARAANPHSQMYYILLGYKYNNESVNVMDSILSQHISDEISKKILLNHFSETLVK